jgi:hypothetical protein
MVMRMLQGQGRTGLNPRFCYNMALIPGENHASL